MSNPTKDQMRHGICAHGAAVGTIHQVAAQPFSYDFGTWEAYEKDEDGNVVLDEDGDPVIITVGAGVVQSTDMGQFIVPGGFWDGSNYTHPDPENDQWSQDRSWNWAKKKLLAGTLEETEPWQTVVRYGTKADMYDEDEEINRWPAIIAAYEEDFYG